MSISSDSNNWDSLTKRGKSVSILQYLSQEKEFTFGELMEQFKISKRGLYLTLKDLETDKLISKHKLGRNTLIKITKEGKHAIKNYKPPISNDDIIEKTFQNTIEQLEQAKLIPEEWDKETKEEFLKKIKDEVIKNLK